MPSPDLTEGSLRHAGRLIPYKLRRSKRRRKTIEIKVTTDGVIVAVPYRTSNKYVKALLRERAPWILKKLAGIEQCPAPTRFADGETMPYLGRAVPLVVEKGDFEESNVRFHKWRFHVRAPDGLDDDELREDVSRAFVRWYWARAAERATDGVDRWWPAMGKGEKPRIIVGNQRSLWGSCAADGTLRFTWRLAMVRPSLMEYVVVHELAHLTVRNHSSDFWDLVRRYLPDALQRRRELRESGRSLPL